MSTKSVSDFANELVPLEFQAQEYQSRTNLTLFLNGIKELSLATEKAKAVFQTFITSPKHAGDPQIPTVKGRLTKLDEMVSEITKRAGISSSSASSAANANFSLQQLLDDRLSIKGLPICCLPNSTSKSWNNCFLNSTLVFIWHTPSLEEAFIRFAFQMSQDNNNALNQLYGRNLLNEYVKYKRDCVAAKEQAETDSGNIREAFNHFFGSVGMTVQDDADQVLARLIGAFKDLNGAQNSPLFTQQFTSKKYKPGTISRLLKDNEKNPQQPDQPDQRKVSIIGIDARYVNGHLTTRSRPENECFIRISLEGQTHLSFAELLRAAFRDDTPKNSAFYWDPSETKNEKMKQFLAVSEDTFFEREPAEFVLSLKRFDRFLQKINTAIAIPTTLSLPPEAIDPNARVHPPGQYELTAVVIHGGSYGGGHYTAMKKINGDWFEFNDASRRSGRKMTPSEVDNLLTKDTYWTPYILHYKKIAAPQAPSAAPVNLSLSYSTLSRLHLDAAAERDLLQKQIVTVKGKLDKLKALTGLRQDVSQLRNFIYAPENKDFVDLLKWLLWMKCGGPDVYKFGEAKLKELLDQNQLFKALDEPCTSIFSNANLLGQIDFFFTNQLKMLTAKSDALEIPVQLETFKRQIADKGTSVKALKEAYLQLPQSIQEQLESAIYQSHTISEDVHPYLEMKELLKGWKDRYNKGHKYGTEILRSDSIREALLYADQPVISVHGKTIVEQLEDEKKQEYTPVESTQNSVGLQMLLDRFKQKPALSQIQLGSCVDQYANLGLIPSHLKDQIKTSPDKIKALETLITSFRQSEKH